MGREYIKNHMTNHMQEYGKYRDEANRVKILEIDDL